ncbi:lasso RiPP family leader peptide-containing protein [Saccharothrix hoggarensis]|uniref:Lasso RiPP family leader peptide-containing protein n=1 Tax=Saccharothrix hoggarensis TaxID=913853 RepID=A0ABW3R641_9PSEU
MKNESRVYVKPVLVEVGRFTDLTLGSRGRQRDSRRRQKN